MINEHPAVTELWQSLEEAEFELNGLLNSDDADEVRLGYKIKEKLDKATNQLQYVNANIPNNGQWNDH